MTLVATAECRTDKTMLRVYDGAQKGATAFFRNRPLLDTVCAQLRARPASRLRVLFHAASIGAEVYSFVIHAVLDGVALERPIEVQATDINAEFLAFAARGRYPAEVLEPMTPAERAFFEPAGPGLVRPIEAVRRRVRFLPPCSFVDAAFDAPFDLVFILNALTYVGPEEQSLCLRRVAGYCEDMLVTCAFHPDTIESDLRRIGFAPVTERIAEIHNAWTERIRVGEPPAPGTPEYSWVVPPFAEVPGFEYRYGAIFRRLP